MALRVTRRNFLGREVAVVFGALVALELLIAITWVRLLQIPGYLILAAYNYAEIAWFPAPNAALFYLGFALYIYVSAVVIANLCIGFQQAIQHDR